MCQKLLSLFCVAILGPAFAGEVSGLPDEWIDTHYGACYISVAEGMSSFYGPDYGTDDNISEKHLTYGADEMIVSIDRTSGTNAPRIIFKKRVDDNRCVVLISPPVTSLVPITHGRISSSHGNG
jgi:hypothetical protein